MKEINKNIEKGNIFCVIRNKYKWKLFGAKKET